MLLTLPPELIQRVVRLALDNASSSFDLTSDERANLRNFSLVHSRLRPWAQAELYHNLRIMNQPMLKRVERAVAGHETRLLRSVREVHHSGESYGTVPVSSSEIEAFFSRCVGVTRFALKSSYMDWQTLRVFPRLRRLSAKEALLRVDTRLPTLFLPHLTHLTLVNAYGSKDTWRKALSPAVLPNVYALSLRQDSFYAVDRLVEGQDEHEVGSYAINASDLAAIVPQLRVLSLKDSTAYLAPSFPWSSCHRLESLTLGCGPFDESEKRDNTAIVDTLLKLPQPLQRLRVAMGVIFSISSAVVAELDRLGNTITERDDFVTKQLTLPLNADQQNLLFGWFNEDDTVYDALQRLEERATERGIKVVRSGSIDMYEFGDAWLRDLDHW